MNKEWLSFPKRNKKIMILLIQIKTNSLELSASLNLQDKKLNCLGKFSYTNQK